MRSRKMLLVISPIMLFFTFFFGCKKNNQESTELSIRMNDDASFNAEEVNVDIKELRANFAKDTLSKVHYFKPTQKIIIY